MHISFTYGLLLTVILDITFILIIITTKIIPLIRRKKYPENTQKLLNKISLFLFHAIAFNIVIQRVFKPFSIDIFYKPIPVSNSDLMCIPPIGYGYRLFFQMENIFMAFYIFYLIIYILIKIALFIKAKTTNRINN